MNVAMNRAIPWYSMPIGYRASSPAPTRYCGSVDPGTFEIDTLYGGGTRPPRPTRFSATNGPMNKAADSSMAPAGSFFNRSLAMVLDRVMVASRAKGSDTSVHN